MRCILCRKCLFLPSTHHISVKIPPFVSLLQAEQHTCEAFTPDDNESWMWTTPVRMLTIQLWCFLILQTCAVSQFRVCILQKEHLKANYVTTPRKGCLQMLLLSPVFGGCTAMIHRGLTYPKFLCAPEKEERMGATGDIAWRRSSLSRTWAAET